MRARIARFVLLAAAAALAAPAPAVRSEDILDHLEKSIAWYRHVQAVEQSSGDVLVRESVHLASLKALQLAFDFARAEAGLVAGNGQAAQNTGSQGANLQQAASRATDRVNGLQARIADMESQAAKATASQKAALDAQRRELESELDLAREIQNTIQTLITFSGSLASGGAGLTAKIDELEGSVPEARHDQQRAAGVPAPGSAPAPVVASSANAAAPPQVFDPQSRGMIGLIGDLFTIRAKRKQFLDLRKETDDLVANIDRLRAPLREEVRSSISRADQIGSAGPAQNAADASASQRELAGLAARFKQVSAAMIPLSEQAIAAGTARSYLQETVADLDENWTKAGRYLLLRSAGLALAIFVILVISSVWRHATFRYVRDPRRRRQFLMLRRVVVAAAVILTVTLGFITEFGSLATYAGFVTAGVAVALQSPILSVVAYFFLIGRYGIRVGDRVTISGVTGEVIEIGLVRIYLMELGPELRSTGRVVVFSNSVIFQPAALYKQMPGLDYVWHTVTLTLSSDSDSQLAETKLTEAVNSVYQQYSEKLERIYRSLEQSIDVDLAAPKPDTHLRYTDDGLEFTVRYPAELKQAALMDDRVMKALYSAIENEPKLKFATSGRPKVHLAA